MNRVAAIVLAAGQGTRFRASGGTEPSKLVAELDGVPLIRHVTDAALASRAAPVVVVTGHAAEAVGAALAGTGVRLVHNAPFATGLASSLRTGIAALPLDADGAIVLLGDMPRGTAGLFDRLLAEAAADPDTDAIVPLVSGRRGNPVVLSRRVFPAVARLSGDAGARHLLRAPELRVREVPLLNPGSWFDVDEVGDLTRPAE